MAIHSIGSLQDALSESIVTPLELRCCGLRESENLNAQADEQCQWVQPEPHPVTKLDVA